MTLWSVLVGGISLLIFGAVVGLGLRRAALGHLDSTLRKAAEGVFAGLAETTTTLDWRNEPEVRNFFSRFVSLYSFEVEQPLGIVAYRSRELGNAAMPGGSDGVPYTAKIGEHETARILQITRGAVRLRVADELSSVTRVQRALGLAYAIFLPATLLLIGFGASRLSRKALKPVGEIAATVERITVDQLDKRLPPAGTNDEIGLLTSVLNGMIDRIQQSFQQARRFSADASHELKTPLTILRGEIEIALNSGNLPPATEKVMLNLLEETGRLGQIVEGLLLLSQADAGKLQMGSDEVDLGALIEDLSDDIEILASPLALTVETNIAPGAMISGSAQFLRQLVTNLFDNAIKYNVADGNIRAELTVHETDVVFTIANTGAEVPPEQRDRIFDRFHRAESSRTRERAQGGQGLGLSICREIALAHGGTLTLVPSEPGWTKFQLTLPRRSKIPGAKIATATASPT